VFHFETRVPIGVVDINHRIRYMASIVDLDVNTSAAQRSRSIVLTVRFNKFGNYSASGSRKRLRAVGYFSPPHSLATGLLLRKRRHEKATQEKGDGRQIQ
jgi:hypothetical protein